MELLRKRAYARAGLVGNPSDGYNGKTLSVIVRDFFAEVLLYEWDDVELILSQEDRSRFPSIRELIRDVELHGYYGGIRLVKATIKHFVDYCEREGHALHDRNFSVRYQTNIPRQVGLAGSSAIIVATLRALMDFYGVAVPQEVQPSLALGVETGELGIAAGLQDRVIQVYEGAVFMDFSAKKMQKQCGVECGVYERIPPASLPPLYVAYSVDVGQPTEIFHNNLRARFDAGEPAVVAAMRKFAELAQQARDALQAGDMSRLAVLVDENFDTRRSICRLPDEHLRMVQTARSVGASAKFAGSGGAIIGTYQDEDMFQQLKLKLGKSRCEVFKPRIEPAAPARSS